jgi:transporter family-2 protein
MTQLARILSETRPDAATIFGVWPLICLLASVNWLVYVLSAGAGLANPAQSGTNAQLKKTLGHPIWATVAVYLSGLAAMLIMQAFVRDGWPSRENFSATPWWAWMGGVLSIASTMTGLVFAQKLGSGVFTGISVTAALASSIPSITSDGSDSRSTRRRESGSPDAR